MTPEHKAAISKSKIGKTLSVDTKKRMSESRFAYIQSKSCEWILISPQNEIKRAKSLKYFCATLKLSYSAFRKKSINGDSRPIERGPSKGWSLYGKSKAK